MNFQDWYEVPDMTGVFHKAIVGGNPRNMPDLYAVAHEGKGGSVAFVRIAPFEPGRDGKSWETSPTLSAEPGVARKWCDDRLSELY